MKPSPALLIAGALLLASCDRTVPAPQPAPADPAAAAPAAPVAGQSLEVQNLPGTADSALKGFAALTAPGNPDLDPDLKALLSLLGRPNAGAGLDRLGAFGKGLAQGLGGRGRVTTQDLTTVREALPTGTLTYPRSGQPTYVATPTDAYVEIDEAANTRLEFRWKVAGAPTVWVNNGYRYDSTAGRTVAVLQEVPTNAAGSVGLSGKTVAGLSFSMTPGECLNAAGPTALTLSGWAGREANAPAQLNLKYAWTEKDVTLVGSALYATTRQKVSAGLNLTLTGTTRDRCGDAFAFTPTRADLTGLLDLPGHRTELNVYLRDLSNLEFSEKAMSAPNALDRIGGRVNASVTFGGKAVVTAFGPLADGSDLNLQPGDQVRVQYVKGGRLVETDLAGAEKDLQALLTPRP